MTKVELCGCAIMSCGQDTTMTKVYIILLISNMYVLEPSHIKLQADFFCGDYGDILREQMADYNEEQNRWILKDGRGDW